MDHAGFVADAKGYLNSHTVELANRDGLSHKYGLPRWITEGNLQGSNSGGHGSRRFTYYRNVQCSFANMGSGFVAGVRRRGIIDGGFDALKSAGKRLISIVDVGGLNDPDNGFRYLPFNANQNNYMSLDGASFAMTGPLTGCTVAVGRGSGGSVWFLHSNDNTHQGYNARQMQALSIREIGLELGIPGTGLKSCLYSNEHFGYNGMGFVWGKRGPGGTWKFYSHYEKMPAQQRFNLKWADV